MFHQTADTHHGLPATQHEGVSYSEEEEDVCSFYTHPLKSTCEYSYCLREKNVHSSGFLADLPVSLAETTITASSMKSFFLIVN